MQESDIEKCIESVQNEEKDPFPFLKHVEYFKNGNVYNAAGIGSRWQRLDPGSNCCNCLNRLVTRIKGIITINGANDIRKHNTPTGCPFQSKSEFVSTEELLQSLKHPSDTTDLLTRMFLSV